MKKNYKSYILPTYGIRNLEFKKGQGSYLISTDNKKYLDFGSGIAVNSLGHCHPKLIKALEKQSKKLWHTSNLYSSSLQEDYAKTICLNSFAEKVFFTNSGVESIECGLKIVRSYHHHHKNYKRKNIITFEGAFHGRTFAAISASKKYTSSFKPLLPGFQQIPFNNIQALKKATNTNTAAILIEPIQGEGGIRPLDLIFLKKIRELCDKNNILLFLDEVQSGFGRSGKLFSHEWANIKPDILATAKGIGSGFPLGACLSTENAAVGMIKGSHGSTYGGNPLAISVGQAVIKEILKKGFLSRVNDISNYLWKKLKYLEKNYNEIIEVRGAGLLLGIKTISNNIEISKNFEKNGLLSVPASDNVIRLAPPLIIKKQEVDKAILIIERTLNEFES